MKLNTGNIRVTYSFYTGMLEKENFVEKAESKLAKANFNIDSDKWERFKKIAKINDSSGSQEIRKFIDKYLSENSQLDLKV